MPDELDWTGKHLFARQRAKPTDTSGPRLSGFGIRHVEWRETFDHETRSTWHRRQPSTRAQAHKNRTTKSPKHTMTVPLSSPTRGRLDHPDNVLDDIPITETAPNDRICIEDRPLGAHNCTLDNHRDPPKAPGHDLTGDDPDLL